MKGYGVTERGQHGWIERQKPVAGPLDAVLRPIAVAPCSSDTHFMHTFEGDRENVILGHEAVAEVVETGALVTKFKPGDKVIVPGSTPSWGAPGTQLRNGNNSHDDSLMGGFKFLNQKDGVFAEFFHVNHADANLVMLPEDVSIEAALMTTDMMPTGFYGAEMADIQYGDSVVVFGIGPVGLMAVAGAYLKGAGKIYAIGTRPNCAALAREYGADEIISYKEGSIVEQIMELEKGQVDKAIIAGGNVSAMNQALELVKPCGVISNVMYLDEEEVFEIPTYLWGLGMGDVTIRGGFCPGGSYRLEKLLNLIRSNRIDPSKLLNYKYEGFDKIEEAFRVMDEKPKDLIKPVVHINW